MVKAMHAAGIEVILDVVYNHTAEGNHLGPTLSFKGIDNAAYYRLMEDDQRYYMDYTGTGNCLNVRHPHSLQLIMDSLRYWVTEMHVDGFRFDLASALAREFYDVDKLSTFFELVQQDPVVSQVKLIAEPWDVGPGGYQVGNFPPQWTEWNGAYRDTVRDFWRGEPHARRVRRRGWPVRPTSTSTPAAARSRRINFVTAHDGFTLRDLVSYNEKHNDANGEGGNDGETTTARGTTASRDRPTTPTSSSCAPAQQRNFLATLLLSQGVPMLLHGDELGRTQEGNNNTYAQDSELCWVDWDKADQPLIEFTAAVVRLRSEHPTFRRQRFFTGNTVRTGDGGASTTSSGCDVDGQPMEGDDWQADGGARDRHVPQRRRHPGHATCPATRSPTTTSFSTSTPAPTSVELTLPPEEYAEAWDVVIDTGASAADPRCPRGRLVVDADRAERAGAARALHPRASSPTARSPPRSPPSRAPGADRHAGSGEHVPVAGHRGLRPAGGRADPGLPPRPGGRLGLPVAGAGRASRGASTGTTSPTTRRSTRRAAARRGCRRCRAKPGGWGWACWSTSCRTTSGSPGPGERLVVARADLRPRVVVRRGLRHRLGRRWRPGAGAGRGRRGPGRRRQDREPERARRRAPLPRPAVPAGARNGRPRGHRCRRRARAPALRADPLAAGGQRAQLPPLLLGQHPGRDPGRGPGVVRPLPRGGRALVRRGARRRPPHRPPRRTARPGAVPRRPVRGDRRRLRAGGEDPRAG